MNHRRASTGGSNMIAVPPLPSSAVYHHLHNTAGGGGEGQYPSSPEKNNGYHEEGDNSDENGREEIVTIITYDPRRRTTRRSSFSGPIARRRGSCTDAAGGGAGSGSSSISGSRRMIVSGNYKDGMVVVDPCLVGPKGTTTSVLSPSSQNTSGGSSTKTDPLGSAKNNNNNNNNHTKLLERPPISIQTSRGINPDIVARMSMVTNGANNNNSELIHLVEDDDDDDDSADEQQTRRGYVGSSNHSGVDTLYGLSGPKQQQQQQQQPSSSSASRTSRMERRPSNASSVHSRSSTRSSQRRRSSVERRKFKSKDPLTAMNAYDNNNNNKTNKTSEALMYDTDDQLDQEKGDDLMSSDDEAGGGGGGGRAGAAVGTFGYESDVASEHSYTGSMSSSKRSKRRNSCIIPNGHDLAALNVSVIAFDNRSRDGMDMMMGATIHDDEEEEEEDDPDSLFNRAKRRSQSIDLTTGTTPIIIATTPKGTKQRHLPSKFNEEKEAVIQKQLSTITDGMSPLPDPVPENGENPSLVTSSSTTDAMVVTTKTIIVPNTNSSMMDCTTASVEPWRTSPLTVSYAAPTEENLKANLKNMLRIDKFSGNNAMALSPVKSPKPKVPRAGKNGHNNPVDADDSNEDEDNHYDDDNDDESSYGANMYTDAMVHSENDYDMYRQKARRRASLENTHYNIDTVYQSKGIKVPNFKPAEGCTNASDFVVRCFTAKMRISGYTVLKHNRSRWSKAKNRVIYLLPDNQTLSWRENDEETTTKTGGKNDTNDMNKKDQDMSDLNPARNKRGPRVDLSKCIEVRYACSIDPKNPKRRGTAVLRSRCKDELAGKSFSLIFANRTLDLTAFSNDQCKVLIEGFSALCFRIQLQKLESRIDMNQNNSSDSDKHNLPDDQCTNVDVDDWASTMFGGSTTNTTNSNCVNGPIPWGR